MLEPFLSYLCEIIFLFFSDIWTSFIQLQFISSDILLTDDVIINKYNVETIMKIVNTIGPMAGIF